MISRNTKESGLLSPRNSVLIWVTGIMLGWGIAVVGVYQWIKSTNNAPVSAAGIGPVEAQAGSLRGRDGKALSDIAPAAGKPAPATPKKH